MADSERPNWVPERAKCNTSVLLEALSQIIEKDVEQANETLGLEDNPFTSELDRGVVEVKRPSFRRPPAVFFVRNTEEIEITGYFNPSTQAFAFAVVPEWDTKACSCRLKIVGQERTAYEPWQIVQLALAWLFFQDWPAIVHPPTG